MSAGQGALMVLRYALALAALVVFLFPLYWLLVTALKTPDEVLAYPPVWWPHAPQVENFVDLVSGGDWRALSNSLIVALLSTLLAVAFGTGAAYAIVRGGLAGRLFASWAAASRMTPPVMVALAFLLVLPGLGLFGGMAVLVLLLAAFNLPYVLWMMRGYFLEAPATLEETALVAGLAREQVFAQVVWPMARGGLLPTAAFTFLLAWNELPFALTFAGDAFVTVPAALARYGEAPELWGNIAALGAAGMLPVPIALALMGPRLARTLSLGVVRG